MITASHHQRGAAFIYVMLIFVAATVIVGGLLSAQNMELNRTARFLDEEQAVQYALGVETYARQLIADDSQNNNAANYSRQAPFSIPDGSVEMQVEDMRSRFNINSLLGNDPAADNYFQVLCSKLGIAEDYAKALLAEFQAIKAAASPPGAPPVPPAWIADVSELVDHHFPINDYLSLAPYITALPSSSYAININTAPDFLLAIYLNDPNQIDEVHKVMKDNGHIGNEQLAQFQNGNNSLTISSDAFEAQSTIHMSDNVLRLRSMLMRNSGVGSKTLVIARKWGE